MSSASFQNPLRESSPETDDPLVALETLLHPLASFLAAARDNAGLRATYPEIRLTRAASYIGQQLEYNDDEVRSLWSRLTSDAIEEYASHPGHAQTNFSPRSVVERIFRPFYDLYVEAPSSMFAEGHAMLTRIRVLAEDVAHRVTGLSEVETQELWEAFVETAKSDSDSTDATDVSDSRTGRGGRGATYGTLGALLAPLAEVTRTRGISAPITIHEAEDVARLIGEKLGYVQEIVLAEWRKLLRLPPWELRPGESPLAGLSSAQILTEILKPFSRLRINSDHDAAPGIEPISTRIDAIVVRIAEVTKFSDRRARELFQQVISDLRSGSVDHDASSSPSGPTHHLSARTARAIDWATLKTLLEPLAQLRGVYSRQRFERILSFIGSQLGYTAEEVLETFEWLGMTFTPDERIRVAETGVEKRLELIFQPLVRIYLETAADRVFNNHSLRDRLKEISDLIGDELDTRGTRSLTDATWDSVVSAVEEERSIDARRSNFDHRPPRDPVQPRSARSRVSLAVDRAHIVQSRRAGTHGSAPGDRGIDTRRIRRESIRSRNASQQESHRGTSNAGNLGS